MTPDSQNPLAQTGQPAQKEEERKKGAAPLTASGGSGTSFSLEQLESLQMNLVRSGASVAVTTEGSIGAALATKVGMIIVVSMLGVGAVNMNKKPRLPVDRPRAKAEKIKYEGDLSKLPSKPEEQDAVQGVVLGDLARKDGQAEADAAAAAAAAKADGKTEAKADEAAKAMAAAASATPAMAAGDLTAKANKSLGGKQGPFDKKFGALSTSLPGGSTAGGTSATSGGPAFNPAAVAAGVSKGLGANQAPKTAAATKAIGSGVRGSAAKQLVNANNMSRTGLNAGTTAGASQAASGAFDNNRGGGSAISGGGAAITGAGATLGATDAHPNSGGNPIGGGGGAGSNGTQPPPDPGHTNDTPWQMFVDIARIALALASVLMLIASILGQLANDTTLTIAAAAAYRTWAMYLAYAACACGAIATLCGIAVLAMGQTTQGLILSLTGGFVTAMAFIYAQGIQPPDNPQGLVDNASTTSCQDITQMQTGQLTQGMQLADKTGGLADLANGSGFWQQAAGYSGSAAGAGGSIFGGSH